MNKGKIPLDIAVIVMDVRARYAFSYALFSVADFYKLLDYTHEYLFVRFYEDDFALRVATAFSALSVCVELLNFYVSRN